MNVGAGDRITLLDLVALVEEASGRRVAVEHGPPRAGDVRDSLAGLERTREVLGYEAKVPVREGIARTWAWWLADDDAARCVAATSGAG